MKRCFLGLILLIFFNVFDIGAFADGKNDFLCVPGVRVGPITAKTTEADLRRIFGVGNVKREKILVAEGTEEITVSYVFKDRKDQIEVRWADEKAAKHCTAVRFYTEGGRWHTKDGIRVGAPLELVNRLNGKSFTFYGFGWDYGGWVNNWGNGKMGKVRLDLRFDCAESDESAEKYMGDGVLIRSDDPGLKKLGVKVAEMIVELN